MKTARIPSIFGEPNKVAYNIARSLDKTATVLIPDGYDGLNALPFLSNGLSVTTYEPDVLFIEGEEIHSRHSIYGLNSRMKAYGYTKKVKCVNKNFYTSKAYKKYDHVYVYKSLHRECNNSISIKDKVNKLIKAVNENGSIYIYYHLPTNDTYESNLYPEFKEMLSYFNTNEWDIILSKERNELRLHKGHYGNETDHYHKIGYIHAKRKKGHIYRFNIHIGYE